VFPLLEPLKHRLGGRLSGGEQQMLTTARRFMGNPSGLLVGEPSEGLAPTVVQRIGELLRALRDMGVTVLLAEPNMHFCLNIATEAAVIDIGKIVIGTRSPPCEPIPRSSNVTWRSDQGTEKGDPP